MKKISYVVLAVLLMLGVTRVNAMSEDDLYDALTQKITIGNEKWGVDEDTKTYIRRYLDQFEVSGPHADYINKRINKAISILKKERKTDFTKLSIQAKRDLRTLVDEISTNTSVKASVKNGALVVYNPKTGKVFYESSKLVKYTGSVNNTVAMVAGLALLIVAAGSVLVVKQVKEN